MKSILAIVVFSLIGCASAQPVAPDTFNLLIEWHCPEGEVGCSNLSGLLKQSHSNTVVLLSGATRMVACKDGVTPCHIASYELAGSGWHAIAYPDGTLVVTAPGGAAVTQKTGWSLR